MEINTHWDEEDYYKWYYDYKSEDWFKFCQDKEKTDGKERKFLYRLANLSQKGIAPSIDQLKWAKKIIDRFEVSKSSKTTIIRKRKGQKDRKMNVSPNTISNPMHATVRMAWHDNRWNGEICSNPENNKYCVGDYSLLSSRLKRRKNLNLECKFKCDPPIMDKMKGYIPPCYWSINAFGDHHIKVEHEHPMLESGYIGETPNIKEKLPPFSVFTWPFKLSFMREENPLFRTDGKYPKNLVPRIEKYFNTLKNKDSIIFLYTNYDNPISADEYKYLLVGCGVLHDKGELHYYDTPEKTLLKVRSDPGNQNFPTVGWDYRLSLDPELMIRLPYHEYLEDAERSNDFSLLDEIKVIIDEPELIPNFKFVSMNLNDDRAIYLLSKIKKSLLKIKAHQRYVEEYNVLRNIDIVEQLLERTWKKRGVLPGFTKLNRILLDRNNDEPVSINAYYKKLQNAEPDTYLKKILSIFRDEDVIEGNDNILDEIDELKRLIKIKKITINDYFTLSLLNFTTIQFQRILKGNIGECKINLKEICNNPYILYEEYESDLEEDPHLGETIDGPINLFEIDIAFFPDTRYVKRFREIQKLYPEDPRRLRSLTIAHLKSLEYKGDCFDIDKNIENTIKGYPLFYQSEYILPDEVLSKPEDSLREHFSEKIVIKAKDRKLYFYLDDLFKREQDVSKIIKKLIGLSNANNSYEVNLNKSVIFLRDNLEEKFDQTQYLSERSNLFPNIFLKKFFVISGSPGCGKSYELLRTVDTLQKNNESCLILTPTGKAALRLSANNEGFKNIIALTIDKFLCENKENKSVDVENVIIDEMSMVDLVKFSDLLYKFDFNSINFKRLILVGDQFQLPPIGYGKVYIDIIRYLQSNNKTSSHYCYLDTNCRQLFDKTIIEFSKIFSGQNKHHEPLIEAASRNELETKGLKIFYWKDNRELEDLIIERFKNLFSNDVATKDLSILLNRVFNLDDEGSIKSENLIDSFQVLSPYRAGYYGTIGLNTFFQETFRTGVNFITKRSLLFKYTDKIIQIKNKYDYKNKKLLLSNGSMGIIDKNGSFYFMEKTKPIPKNLLKEEEIELAYSITVHKSQGSGFEEVFLIIPPKETLMSRELLYTALTRSKKSLSIFIYGDPSDDIEQNIFEKTRKNSNVEVRKTSLLGNPYWDYKLSPSENVWVRSRVEYIIYKKLEEFKNALENDDYDFSFEYEKKYSPHNSSFIIKPDFTIKLPNGKIYFLEHLGLLNNYSYRNNWYNRKHIYEKDGLTDRLITTDELNGIKDDSVGKVIEDILFESIKTTDNKYSMHHYSLG